MISTQYRKNLALLVAWSNDCRRRSVARTMDQLFGTDVYYEPSRDPRVQNITMTRLFMTSLFMDAKDTCSLVILYVISVIIGYTIDIYYNNLATNCYEDPDEYAYSRERLMHLIKLLPLLKRDALVSTPWRADLIEAIYHRLKELLTELETFTSYWTGDLAEERAHRRLDMVREELIAAAWAPQRHIKWCLDEDERAEIYNPV